MSELGSRRPEKTIQARLAAQAKGVKKRAGRKKVDPSSILHSHRVIMTLNLYYELRARGIDILFLDGTARLSFRILRVQKAC
jgi:hypothetical protein